MSNVAHVVRGSAWQLLQTSELPNGSWCKSVARDDQQHIWHAWHTNGFCLFHHLGGLKAPVARVVANRRRTESACRPRREAAG